MTDKESKYQQLVRQVEALVENETEPVGVLANVASAIHHAFDNFFWTGFYLIQNKVLRLGPFQGTPACYDIPVGKGVCGTAVAEDRTIVGVLDIDSTQYATFDTTDQRWLEKIVAIVTEQLYADKKKY